MSPLFTGTLTTLYPPGIVANKLSNPGTTRVSGRGGTTVRRVTGGVALDSRSQDASELIPQRWRPVTPEISRKLTSVRGGWVPEAQFGRTSAFALATELYQEALGLARRSNVTGSTLWSPNLGRNPWDHS